MWQPIQTAPKDGTVILVYEPGGFEIDDHVYTWPEGAKLSVTPARWHMPNQRTDEKEGWYPPSFRLSFGVYDDPSTDIDAIPLDPSHWMPMPEPPTER